MSIFVFFFQAEDGIRDVAVTGVQTCALPIYLKTREHLRQSGWAAELYYLLSHGHECRGDWPLIERDKVRSEERRVGKESRTREWTHHKKKKKLEQERADSKNTAVILTCQHDA